MNQELIYLASPYSHPDKKIELLRYELALKHLAKFMNEGHYLFSPIVHCHNAAVKYGLPTDWNYWKGYCCVMVPLCKRMWVLTLDGWEQSSGIKGETDLAKELNIPIDYIEI